MTKTNEFVKYLTEYFDIFLFDFDFTMCKEAIYKKLELSNWKELIDKEYLSGKEFISNNIFFNELLDKIKDTTKKIFIVTHCNNGEGIQYILEHELNKDYMNINIIYGIDNNISKYKPIGISSDTIFYINSSKVDMFNFIKSYLGELDKRRTILFDDNIININTLGSNGLGLCITIYVSVMYDINCSDSFNELNFDDYYKMINNQLKNI